MVNIKDFRYAITPEELAYLLFKKKSCPGCGGRMKQETCCRIMDASVFPTEHTASGIIQRSYFYRFSCTECGAVFPLSELSGKRK